MFAWLIDALNNPDKSIPNKIERLDTGEWVGGILSGELEPLMDHYKGQLDQKMKRGVVYFKKK
jgi:hypothetical protein